MAKRKKRGVGRTRVSRQEEPSVNPLQIEVENLLAKQEPQRALEVLKQAPARFQRSAEFYLLRGSAFGMLNDFHSAVNDLETAIQKDPGLYSVYLNLALAYASLEYWVHAWRTADRYLRRMKKSPASLEGEDLARQIIARAQAGIQHKVEKVGISPEAFLQLGLYHEKGQLYLANGEYGRALKEINQAIRLAPDWAPAHNNRALVYFYSGQMDQAIAEEQMVLKDIDSGNIHALGNLILCHTCLWQPEQANSFAGRLNSLLASSLEDLDLVKAIESLGIMEDDQGLWDLARRLVDYPADSLPGSSWYILGAAAANTGHLDEAEQLLKRAKSQAGIPQDWINHSLEAVRKAKRSHQPAIGACLTGRFPYTHFTQFWPTHIAERVISGFSDTGEDSAMDRHLEKYVSRYPFAAYAGKLMLWCEGDETGRKLAIELLAASGNPAAYQEIKRFAVSQYGGDEERMQALAKLRMKGQFGPEDTINFWSAKNREWKEIRFMINKITEAYTPTYHPKASRLVDQSSSVLAKGREDPTNQAQAAQYLQKAIEIDPSCAIAVHNLGVIYVLQGKKEEGEALMRRSVEIDPGYLFGYTSLAEIEFGRENLEGCKDLLDQVISAPEVPANAMCRALAIQVRVALEQEEIEAAKTSLEMIKSIAPEYPEISNLELLVKLRAMSSEWADRWQENARRYHERHLDKAISAGEKLASCLDRITRDALAETLRKWGCPSTGRKAQVISRLVDVMLDPQYLTGFVGENLSEKEQEAIAWVLEGGGRRNWVEFTGRFGDDIDESPYWQYHEPETIPGRLRVMGLLAVGRLDGERVALIPAELRPLLKQAISIS